MHSQRRNQASFEPNVTNIQTVVAGGEVFVDISPKTKRSMLEASSIDSTFEAGWKLMAKAKRPYKLFRPTPEMEIIEQDGLENPI